MRALLDTHAFLWWVTHDSRLSPTAKSIITDSSNLLFLSAASVWEIFIKVRLGKLTLPEPLETYIPSRLTMNRIESLPITFIHTLLAHLPNLHQDPFDRIIIAPRQVENMPIVTVDSKITQYPIDVIW